MKDYTTTAEWIFPEKDFEDLFVNGQYKTISDLSEENLNLLFRLFKDNKLDQLQSSIRFGNIMLSYLQGVLEDSPRESAAFDAGKLMGYIELLDRLRFSEEQEQMDRKRAENRGSKHLNPIIHILETHGSVSQSDLADMLRLQPSTLSEALKKVRQTGFVQVTPYGKYKLYSLTESGIRYGALLRRKERSEADFRNLLTRLREYLQNGYWKKFADDFFAEMRSSCGAVISPGENISIFNNHTREITKYQIDCILQTATNLPNQGDICVFADPCFMGEASVNQIRSDHIA